MSKELINGNSNAQEISSFWRPVSRPLPGSAVKVTLKSASEVEDKQVVTDQLDNTADSFVSSSEPVADMTTSKKPVKKGSSSGTESSFRQYEANTLDAWDDGDDDLLVRLKLDSNFIKSTANQVINNHNHTTKAPSTTKPLAASKSEGSQPSSTPDQKNRHQQRPQQQNGGGRHQRSMSEAQIKREQAKQKKFEMLLNSPPKNLLDELRTLSWSGIPSVHRPDVWKLLCGYLPPALDRRQQTLERKRKEYFGFLDQYFGTRHEDQFQDIFRQIHIDVPRMNPLIPLFQNKLVQEIFERILYIWAIRHPASGYVQGINDLVTPFFVVFLSDYLDMDFECKDIDITSLTKEQLDMIEADSYWCMSKLLDGIQDNYTFAQPGIQIKVAALKELTLRIDVNLHNHIEKQGIEFLQFTFRWMNNLLMRELPLRCTVRLWDTYLAEPEGFANYHLYVCAAFLTKFSKQLVKEHDFQGLMTLLQNLPTSDWHDSEIEELTAEAYRLKYMFADAPQHFKQKT